jgi:hypothetical protein
VSNTPQLIAHAMNVLAAGGTIDNPAPVNPLSNSSGGDLITSYVKYGALFICAVIAAASGGWAAWGGLSRRPDAKSHGLTGVLCAVIGAVVVAVGIPLINGVYNTVS